MVTLERARRAVIANWKREAGTLASHAMSFFSDPHQSQTAGIHRDASPHNLAVRGIMPRRQFVSYCFQMESCLLSNCCSGHITAPRIHLMKVLEAKDFLVRQTAEQAALENVPLSDLENAWCTSPRPTNARKT